MQAATAATAPGIGLRILAVVELGGNWGHLLRLLPVIDCLEAEGHRVLLAVPDVAGARTVLQRPDLALVQCPGALVHGQTAPFEYEFYAQILERCVFGDAQLLARSVAQWDALLQSWRPDAMLTDFAPGALFAARLHRLPVVQVPVGWEAPPPGPSLPVIRPWKNVDPDTVLQYEKRLAGRLNRWCDARGAVPLGRLSDLYAIGSQLLTTFAEIDAFAPRGEGACYVGPVFTQDRGQAVDWAGTAPDGRTPRRVLAYLRPSPAVVPVLLHLRKATGADIVAVLQGLAPAAVAQLRAAGVRVSDGAVQLQRLLPEADLAVTNAGHGVAAAALLAGVPLLAIPLTIDQFFLAARLEATGAAVSLPGATFAAGLQDAVERLLSDGSARRAARAVAARYAGRSQYRTLRAVAQALSAAAGSTAAARERMAIPARSAEAPQNWA